MKKLLFVLLLLAGLAVLVYVLVDNQQQSDEETTNTAIAPENNRTMLDTSGLRSCQVCGYIAMEKPNDSCRNCHRVVNQRRAQMENLSLDEFIILGQLEYFLPDSNGQRINFMAPTISEKGYPKNPNWESKVYETEVMKFYRLIKSYQLDSLNS